MEVRVLARHIREAHRRAHAYENALARGIEGEFESNENCPVAIAILEAGEGRWDRVMVVNRHTVWCDTGFIYRHFLAKTSSPSQLLFKARVRARYALDDTGARLLFAFDSNDQVSPATITLAEYAS